MVVLALAWALTAAADTGRARACGTPAATVCRPLAYRTAGPDRFARAPRPMAADTDQQKLFEYSDAYGTRLTIHRWASYAMLPLFVAQFAAGEELRKNVPQRTGLGARQPRATGGRDRRAVRGEHGNRRFEPARGEARPQRSALAHSAQPADAGGRRRLALTAATVGESEHEGFGFRREGGGNISTHRTLAITLMSAAVVSWLMMIPPFRRD